MMIQEQITTIIKDAVNYRKVILATFIICSIAALIVGSNWPKFYTTNATVFIEEENILGPLMRGAAVQTEVVDRAKIAREIVYGRDFVLNAQKEAGLLIEGEITPREEEWLVDKVRSRMTITNVGKNLIKFSYKDTDAEKAFVTLAKTVDLFISESLATKLQESRSAFEFIDKQVKEYHVKLITAEEELKKFRSKNIDVRQGSAAEISARIQDLQKQVTDISQQLREAKIKKETLLSQLSGEAETAAGLSRAEAYRARIIEMQNQLDTLLLNYHETYPDVVRIRNQIQDLQDALKREESGETPKATGNTVVIEGVVVDERIQASPVYQQLRTDLYTTNSQIQTLTSRLKDANKLLEEQEDLGRRTHELQATLAELERDYTVNSDIYQDFLRRREAARVSMNVDLEQKGLSLRIDEPPFLPHNTSGLSLKHFVLIGMLAGLIIPIGVLYGVLQIDPRIRTAGQLQEITDLNIIGTIYEYYSDDEITKTRNDIIVVGIIGLVTVAVVVIVALNLR